MAMIRRTAGYRRLIPQSFRVGSLFFRISGDISKKVLCKKPSKPIETGSRALIETDSINRFFARVGETRTRNSGDRKPLTRSGPPRAGSVFPALGDVKLHLISAYSKLVASSALKESLLRASNLLW